MIVSYRAVAAWAHICGMDPSKIPWRGNISIEQVLSGIREAPGKAFWLAFVRATGKSAGSVKVVSVAIYGAPRYDNSGKAKPVKNERARVLHTEKGTLPMTDSTNGEYLTPLISHIIGYNMYRVKH